MELIDSGEKGGGKKNIKDRANRTNHKYDYKRNKTWKIKSEIELKEMIFSYGHQVLGLQSLTASEISNLENLVGHLNDIVTAKQTSIKGLRAERDSWIGKCKKHEIVSNEDLEELARCKGEISRGREDRLNKIVGSNIQLEELLGHSMDLQISNDIPYAKKLELQIARLQCEIEMELEFEIKELKLEIKGFEDDCKLAATATDNHKKLKESCLNTLRNADKRSQTVNLQLEDEVTRKELVIQLLRCVKGFPLQEKMETNGQKNQEFTRVNELVWNNACGILIDLGMDLPGMKEADDFLCDHEGRLSCTVDELLGDSSTHAEASSSKQVFSEEFSKLDCAALLRPPGPSVLLTLAKQTDAGRLLTVEKGKSVVLEGNKDSLLSCSYVTLPTDAPRGRGRGRRGRSSRGRSNGSRGRGLTRNASLVSVDADKRPIISGDPNPRPQQRLRPLGVSTTPIPSPAVQKMTLWNSLDVTKSRAATLFSESDNVDARTFLNTCTPEDALQLNCFKLLNVCQVAIQEAHSRGAEFAKAKREAEQALARERVALSTVEHLKKEYSSLELQLWDTRRENVESWVGSQSFANTLVPLKDYQFAMGFSQCRALIAEEDPDYNISWLRATPTERFKWDGWTLMQEPLLPPPVYFDEEGGVPPHPPEYPRLEPYEDEVPFPSEDGGQAQEE